MEARQSLGAAAIAVPRRRRRMEGLAGAGYVLATALSFPQVLPGSAGHGVLDGGWLFGWLGPACLIAACARLRPGRAARRGLVLGLLAHAAILYWAFVVTVVYGHAPVLAGLLAPFGMALYPALFVAAFAAALGWLGARGGATPWQLAALWTALDHGRSWLFSGFPWATLGYAAHHNPALLGLASWTGVYGMSFALALGGAALAAAARGRRTEAAAAAAGVLALHALGLAARPPAEPAAAQPLVVAALQGNVDQGVKWDRAQLDRTFGLYAAATREAVARGARVVVWPETALPLALELAPPIRERLAALARETRATLVVGAVGTSRPARGGAAAYYDSAYVVGPDGEWVDRYDKSHLVPFGEYVPLRAFIGRLVGAIASGVAPGDVTAGAAPRVVDLPVAGPGEARRVVRAGIPICYELVFPDLVRRFVRDGAGVLFAITNDAWYGRTGAPYQFLAMTAVRSAETGTWTLRAANTGVSAVIDGRGQVREQTPIFERATLVATVPVARREAAPTLYARYGDVFAAGCLVAAVAGFARVRQRRGAATDARQAQETT